jgi:hypothetical protein
MNLEIRTEAEQFLFEEYINRIFFCSVQYLSLCMYQLTQKLEGGGGVMVGELLCLC